MAKLSKKDPCIELCEAIINREKLASKAFFQDSAGVRYVRTSEALTEYKKACKLVETLRDQNRPTLPIGEANSPWVKPVKFTVPKPKTAPIGRTYTPKTKVKKGPKSIINQGV
jgi:hypothetical protein